MRRLIYTRNNISKLITFYNPIIFENLSLLEYIILYKYISNFKININTDLIIYKFINKLYSFNFYKKINSIFVSPKIYLSEDKIIIKYSNFKYNFYNINKDTITLLQTLSIDNLKYNICLLFKYSLTNIYWSLDLHSFIGIDSINLLGNIFVPESLLNSHSFTTQFIDNDYFTRFNIFKTLPYSGTFYIIINTIKFPNLFKNCIYLYNTALKINPKLNLFIISIEKKYSEFTYIKSLIITDLYTIQDCNITSLKSTLCHIYKVN